MSNLVANQRINNIGVLLNNAPTLSEDAVQTIRSLDPSIQIIPQATHLKETKTALEGRISLMTDKREKILGDIQAWEEGSSKRKWCNILGGTALAVTVVALALFGCTCHAFNPSSLFPIVPLAFAILGALSGMLMYVRQDMYAETQNRRLEEASQKIDELKSVQAENEKSFGAAAVAFYSSQGQLKDVIEHLQQMPRTSKTAGDFLSKVLKELQNVSQFYDQVKEVLEAEKAKSVTSLS